MPEEWPRAGGWQANNNLLSHFDLIDLPLTRRVAGAQILRIVVTTRDLSVAGDGNEKVESGKRPCCELVKMETRVVLRR